MDNLNWHPVVAISDARKVSPDLFYAGVIDERIMTTIMGRHDEKSGMGGLQNTLAPRYA